MKKIDIRGKSRDEIKVLLRTRRRKSLLDIIRELGTLDQHFTAEQIARARCLPKREIIKKMKAGELQGNKLTPYRWTASLSAIRDWDAATAVKIASNGR
jgi:hypothetical protein